VIATMSIDT